MNICLRIANTLLLIAILWTLFQIRVHMPPTLGEIRSTNPEGKKSLVLRRPYFNSVEVDNTPLSVEIENTPIAVQIER